eukprot:54703-Pyramimonas_sp.AAC.1
MPRPSLRQDRGSPRELCVEEQRGAWFSVHCIRRIDGNAEGRGELVVLEGLRRRDVGLADDVARAEL